MNTRTILVAAGLVGLCIVGATHGRGGDAPAERTTYWASGTPRSRCVLEDGREHGPAERWYRDGSPEARGSYEAGRMEGRWEFWLPDGRPDELRSGLYRDGLRVEAESAHADRPSAS
jgi:antitoxin component YwqK of YwqJK toxin-antitoxin module